jgi:hypothetical protein
MRQITFVFLWFLILIISWEALFAIPELPTLSRIAGMFTVLLGVASALVSGRLRFPLPLVWIALFAGWCAVSSGWAPDPAMSKQRATTYVLLLALVWLICEFADDPKRLKALMRAFLLGTSMMVLNMYLGYVHAGVPLNVEGEVRYTAASTNANGFALFCNLGILFAFYLITRREKNGFELPNWFYWGFIVAAGVAIPMTGSRAGCLAGAVTAFVLLSRLRKVNWKARIGIVVAVLLVAILISQLVGSSTISRITEGTSANTFLLRYNAWVYGLRAWADTPLLGVGAGGYADTVEKLGYRRMVAHDTLVSVLVETGLVGFTLYFAFWAIVARRVLLFPKADRFFWLGVFACYLPEFLSASLEYQKSLWFLGALVMCQTWQPSAAGAKKRATAPSVVRGLSLRPPRPHPS